MEINKLDLKTKNIVSDNISFIENKFPNCIIENGKKKSIDFELLKQELSKDIVEAGKEKYQLTWPGKKESIVTANTPTTKTLRPLKEKSVDFDNTENIYIEGDNLEVLKILQESYLNKIKCIYIDPPYNTGNDFIYSDHFDKEKNKELKESGQKDENENRLISNAQSNGRFHSTWLSMMYSRIKLSRNLLKSDGIFMISIDDNEKENLKKICDELFGEKNYISCISWYKGFGKNDSKFIRNLTEYIYIYSKNVDCLSKLEFPFLVEKEGYSDVKKIQDKYISLGINKENKEKFEKELKAFYSSSNLKGITSYNKVDENNFKIYRGISLEKPADPCYFYDIIHPITGKPCVKPKKGWVRSEASMNDLIQENMILFGADETFLPQRKAYLDDMRFETPNDFIINTDQGGKDIKDIFGSDVFSFPKPVSLIKRLIEMCNFNEGIVLDFFGGSSTTAHAVLELNAYNNKNLNYIIVQLNEECKGLSAEFKEKYKTICDIGEERIRRAANIIKKETNADIDYGFRVFKVDSSNMKDVYYLPTELKQSQLNMFETNIKDDRTAEDLLTQVILDLGLTLDLKIEEKKILNNNVYFVADNSLVACFDDEININIIDEICKFKPLKIVFKESSFKTDSDKINIFERIKKLSNETEINII